MKEVPKDEVSDVSGGRLPAETGGGLVIPGLPLPGPGVGYPQIPTVPCFPDITDPTISRSKS